MLPACGSDLLFLNFLTYHFPKLKSIVNKIYTITKFWNLQKQSADALQSFDVEKISIEFSKLANIKVYNERESLPNRPSCDTKQIKENMFPEAFTTYNTKHMEDMGQLQETCTVSPP